MQIFHNQRAHLTRFIALNEAWISRYFSIEEADRKLAEDPFSIVDKGGCILSLVSDNEVMGVCALFKENESRFQLARMAVDSKVQGKGYGDVLIQAALEQAKIMGAESVYLLSNTCLTPAISLYRKHGFHTLSEGQHPIYARCNIVMERPLTSPPQINQQEENTK